MVCRREGGFYLSNKNSEFFFAVFFSFGGGQRAPNVWDAELDIVQLMEPGKGHTHCTVPVMKSDGHRIPSMYRVVHALAKAHATERHRKKQVSHHRSHEIILLTSVIPHGLKKKNQQKVQN